jgi:hypothetical protein
VSVDASDQRCIFAVGLQAGECKHALLLMCREGSDDDDGDDVMSGGGKMPGYLN